MFRGCTRPAMFMGVPYVPFFVGAGGVFLFSVYTNFFFLGLLPVVIFTMRQMAKRDEMIFKLLGLRLQFRLKTRNIDSRQNIWTYTPNIYRAKPPGE
jgi:type IV secretion system protein VirB3